MTRKTYKPTKREEKLLEILTDIAVNWGADEYASDGLRTLEMDLRQAIKNYSTKVNQPHFAILYSGEKVSDLYPGDQAGEANKVARKGN